MEPRNKGRLWLNGAPTVRGAVWHIYHEKEYPDIPEYVVVAKEFWEIASRKVNDPGTNPDEIKVIREHAVSTTNSIQLGMQLGMEVDGLSTKFTAKFRADFNYSVTVSDVTTKEFVHRTVSDPKLICDNVLWQRYLTIHVVHKDDHNAELTWPVGAYAAVVKPDYNRASDYQGYLLPPPQGIRVPIDEDGYNQLTKFEVADSRVPSLLVESALRGQRTEAQQ